MIFPGSVLKTFAIFAKVKRYKKESRIDFEKFLNTSRKFPINFFMFASVFKRKEENEESRIYLERFLIISRTFLEIFTHICRVKR